MSLKNKIILGTAIWFLGAPVIATVGIQGAVVLGIAAYSGIKLI